MAMRDYMKDLMLAQKASEVRIVHDASMAALPDDNVLFGNSSDGTLPLRSSLCSRLDDISYEDSTIYSIEDNSTITSPGSSLLLGGFRERHRKLKETLSPVKVYRWSPSKAASLSQTTPSSASSTLTVSRGRDNQRSRLIRLASDSNIIDGPPEVAGSGWWKL